MNLFFFFSFLAISPTREHLFWIFFRLWIHNEFVWLVFFLSLYIRSEAGDRKMKSNKLLFGISVRWIVGNRSFISYYANFDSNSSLIVLNFRKLPTHEVSGDSKPVKLIRKYQNRQAFTAIYYFNIDENMKFIWYEKLMSKVEIWPASHALFTVAKANWRFFLFLSHKQFFR